jgi:hypothetical protein
MNVPNLPNVSIPGTKKKATEYSMHSSAIHNSQTRADGDDHDEEQLVHNSGTLDAIGGFFNDEGEEAKRERTWEEKEKETSFTLEEDLHSLMYLC